LTFRDWHWTGVTITFNILGWSERKNRRQSNSFRREWFTNKSCWFYRCHKNSRMCALRNDRLFSFTIAFFFYCFFFFNFQGVIEFSMCLFFAKLVSYTFLYWLPNYIKYTCKSSVTFVARIITYVRAQLLIYTFFFLAVQLRTVHRRVRTCQRCSMSVEFSAESPPEYSPICLGRVRVHVPLCCSWPFRL